MQTPPNIVLILTDNQQATTLGCYGNNEVFTPNLDRLSKSGLTFDNAFCPNAFCSPCRASVLTGLMPSQHGIHSWIDDRNMDEWPSGWHALDGMQTLPKMLHDAGYSTALIGKYHLGEPTTPAEGFDNWVTLEDGHVRSFWNNRVFENGRSYDHKGSTVDFFTGKAREFMEEQVSADRPFFLFLPYPAPYGHWPATRENIRNRHSERYDNCPMNSVPREGISAAAALGYRKAQEYSSPDLDLTMLVGAPNDLPTLRNYYAQISMVDDGVGEIMASLEALGIEEDTLLIFTTDHGISVGQHGFWGHGASTLPSNMHRATHSVPLILRQKGVTPEGERSALMVSNHDLFATILDHVGLKRAKDEFALSSRSLLPVMSGGSMGDWGEDVVYSEQEETRVARTPKWVLFKRIGGSDGTSFGNELYDLENDPNEIHNLSGDPAYAEFEARLSAMIDEFFRTYSKPEADLWTGGLPIQNSTRHWLWRDMWGEDWEPVYRYGDD